MGYSIGYDEKWKRDIGYGVPAYCDHPGCNAEIDRGLSYVCGGTPYGGEKGCGLYFCADHLAPSGMRVPQRCRRCERHRPPFSPKADHPEWMRHKMTDESWAAWRAENRLTTSESPNDKAQVARTCDTASGTRDQEGLPGAPR